VLAGVVPLLAGDKAPLPTQHRVGANDQERTVVAGSVHGRAEHREDRSVGVSELRSGDLALQNQNLVAQRQDLGGAGATRSEQPTESGQNNTSQSGKQGHNRKKLPTRPTLEHGETHGGRVFGTLRRRARISASRESQVAMIHRHRVRTRRARVGKRVTSAERY
jgi:hypothetical protein